MPMCCAVGCMNAPGRPGTSKDTSYHRFPISKPALHQRWVQNVGRENFTPNSNSRLCSHHFLPSCFTEDKYAKYGLVSKIGKPKKYLIDDAVPTEFAHRQTSKPKQPRKRTNKKVIAELLACMDAEPAKDDKIKRGRGILGKQMLSSQSIASDGTVVKTELEGSSSPQELTAAEKTDLTASTLLQQLTAASQKNKSSDLGQHFLSRDTNKITSTTAPIICGIDVMAPQATQVLQIVPNSEHIPCNDSTLEAATKDKTVTTNKGIVLLQRFHNRRWKTCFKIELL